MTDWIEHTTDTCPVDPDTVVEVRHTKHHRVSSGKALYMAWGRYSDRLPGDGFGTPVPEITHYRIVTPAKPPELEGKEIDPRGTQMWIKRQPDRIITTAPTPLLFLGGDPVKPPELEMTKTAQEHAAAMFATAIKPEPDLITLRLECLKLAVSHFSILDREQVADRLLHYVLNGSVDKA
jgi:hypothetical protein